MSYKTTKQNNSVVNIFIIVFRGPRDVGLDRLMAIKEMQMLHQRSTKHRLLIILSTKLTNYIRSGLWEKVKNMVIDKKAL